MDEATLTKLAIGSFVLGVALMIPFEGVATRVLGLLCLFGFIVLGLFAIATPERLRDEPGPDERAGRPPISGSS